MGLALLESAQWKDQSKLTQTGTEEILTHYKKKPFHHEGKQILKKAFQGSCWISTTGGDQNSNGCSPEKLHKALMNSFEPALDRKIDEMNDNCSLQLMILWSYSAVYLQLEVLEK